MKKPLRLGAVMFPGFEMLDLFGPLEMFSALGTENLRIHTVAERAGAVGAAIVSEGPIGPRVIADFAFDTAPHLDVLLVPGGFGSRGELENPAMLEFLTRRCSEATWVTSVCTGSALLARAGVLNGRRATSNKQVFALATQQSDAVDWVSAARWVEDGKFFTSSGVTAGMDMSLALIAKIFGEEVATGIARHTEYHWHKNAADDPFAEDLNALAKRLGMV